MDSYIVSGQSDSGQPDGRQLDSGQPSSKLTTRKRKDS